MQHDKRDLIVVEVDITSHEEKLADNVHCSAVELYKDVQSPICDFLHVIFLEEVQ